MNGTVRRQRTQKILLCCGSHANSPSLGEIQPKLSAGRVLRLVGHQRRSGLVAGIAILLCLTCAGCSGFFIKPTISSIFITPSAATICSIGNTQQLTANANYSDGSQGKLTSSTVGWTSANTAVATVTNGGLVTAVGAGTATMTASDQGVSGTATITVPSINITTITINTTPGNSASQSTATITGSPVTQPFCAYSNLTSHDVTNSVSWFSSNTGVATISSGLSGGADCVSSGGVNGLATSVAPGTTTITATATNCSGALITSNPITLTVK